MSKAKANHQVTTWEWKYAGPVIWVMNKDSLYKDSKIKIQGQNSINYLITEVAALASGRSINQIPKNSHLEFLRSLIVDYHVKWLERKPKIEEFLFQILEEGPGKVACKNAIFIRNMRMVISGDNVRLCWSLCSSNYSQRKLISQCEIAMPLKVQHSR